MEKKERARKNKIELYKQQKNHKNYMILYYDISKANKNAMENKNKESMKNKIKYIK